MRVGWLLKLSAPLGLGMTLLTCGGNSPTANTPASPTPTARPSATPTPPPTNCARLGYVASSEARCNRESAGSFQAQVDAAVNQVVLQHGELFENGTGGVRTKNFGAFIIELLKNLEQAGSCGGFDGEEVGVKNTNDFNEQYKLVVTGGWLRTGPDSYRATCKPAAFPTPPPGPIPPPPGCNLGSSREIACGPTDIRYLGDMKAAIDQVVAEHPELFNLDDVVKGTSDGYKVLDPVKYHDLVAAALIKQGTCARFDGEEVVAKKSNEFSEHFDILTGDSHIRRGDGEYRTSCYPAAF